MLNLRDLRPALLALLVSARAFARTPPESIRPAGLDGVFLLEDAYVGASFLDGFEWFENNDPTHGRVNYVNQTFALDRNLTFHSTDKFIMRADDHNVVSQGSRGRDSIRIFSKKAYGDAIIVADIEHMPVGCGTWPALWTVSKKGPWPSGGEVDIIEGVNNQVRNLATLHTSPNCTMPSTNRTMAGTATSSNCDAAANGNQGCGVSFSNGNSYGAPFNTARGGWYVMQRTSDQGVSVWFWSRNDTSVPLDVQFNATALRPDSSWGAPEATFPPNQCTFDDHFDDAEIVFDLTFCGDWAGSVYGSMGCSGSCTDFVDKTPSAFAEAFWEVNSLRVYTPMDNPEGTAAFAPEHVPQFHLQQGGILVLDRS